MVTPRSTPGPAAGRVGAQKSPSSGHRLADWASSAPPTLRGSLERSPAPRPEAPSTAMRPPSPPRPRAAGLPEPAPGCARTSLSADRGLSRRAPGHAATRPPGVAAAAGQGADGQKGDTLSSYASHARRGAGLTSRG